jgi:outer membrane protein TolC
MILDRTRRSRNLVRTRAAALLFAVTVSMPAAAQQSAAQPTAPAAQTTAPAAQTSRALSLDDAIRIAARESEALRIARAGVNRATGQFHQARSGYLPQLNSSLSYARTLRSQFSALANSGPPDTSTAPKPQSLCSPQIPDDATPAERAAALAQATTCPAAQGIDFTKVGFGARNAWTLGLSFSQNVFSGGRVSGQNAAARAGQRSAEVELTSQRAQLALDVTQAYFDAVLADRLVAIADTTLAQTEELLRQTTLARRVGNQSEFELLRATVTRDNQRPVVIARRGDRDVAYLRLKQLLNLPLDEPLSLTTPIDQPETITRIIATNASASPDATLASLASDTLAALPISDTLTSARAPVRESELAVRAQEGQLRVARADRFPSLALTSNYQRLFFPQSVFPNLNEFSENWSVGGSISLSLFSGGRVTGGVEVARANLEQARAQLQQTRELAALDTRVALNQLRQAEAAFAASRGTASQAQRAYSIDQIRYREGISTQTDLTQSRLLLVQAVANQAQSARDLAVARARIALIRDLPLDTQALGGAAARATTQQQAPQQQPQQPSPQQQTPTSTAANPTGAGPSGSFTQ